MKQLTTSTTGNNWGQMKIKPKTTKAMLGMAFYFECLQ